MTTLKLKPDPTFSTSVEIPVPGKGLVPVKFEFRHMTRDGLLAFLKRSEKLSDVDYVTQIATGWELDDDFNKKNVGSLLDSYGGAARAIASRYIEELTQTKAAKQE